jgi:predicted permease
MLRRALGASHGRLIAHVLVEACALALAGGAIGVGIAWAAAPLLAALVPNAPIVPGLERIGVNAGVLVFSFGAAIAAAALASGVASAGLLRLDGGSSPGARRHTGSARTQFATSALVAAEIAIAVVLLAGAGLTLRSFSHLLAVDPGFTPDGVLAVELSLPEARYREDDARRAFYSRVFERLQALPEVEAVGAAMVTPLTGNNWSVPLQRADRPTPAGQRAPDVGWQLASEGYFRALQIPLRAGRLFEAADSTGPAVVIVSEAVADRFFPGDDPVGRRLSLGDTNAEIVGVVGNIRRAALTDEPRADLYFPFERVMSPSTTLFVRTGGDPLRALPAVRTVFRAMEPHAVLYDTRTLSAIAAESAAATRLASRLLGCCAAIALALAGIGVYGTMAYRVRRRTRELGTRIALGASPADIRRLVVRQAAAIAAAGLIAGAAGALIFARSLSSLLFDVAPSDPATLAGAVAILAAATLGASYLPARRAARVDPVVALGAE